MTDITDIPPEEAARPTISPDGQQGTTSAPVSDDARIDAARDEDLGSFTDGDVARVRGYDTATLVMANSFGAVIPGAVQMVHAAAILAMERHGDFSLSNGGGTLAEYFREKFEGRREEGDEKDDDDGWEAYAEFHQQERERRERWDREEHSLGHVTMTGKEWAAFADELERDTPLRRWLVEDIMRRENKTEAQAKKQAREISLLARMQSIPKEDWTPDMKALDLKLAQEPELRTKYIDYIERGRDPEAALKTAVSAKVGGINPDEQLAKNTSTTGSVGARADLFATAPDLGEHHKAALAATEPLDSKPAVDPAPKPPAPPRPAHVAAAPGGGFDV